MRKKFFFIFLFFMTIFSCKAVENEAAKIVEEYLNEQIHINLEDYYTVQSYFHPDLAFPPGENQLLRVVSDEFEIIDISIEKMNINLLNPKIEKIIVVTVKFETYCDVINDELRNSVFLTRKYYLSEYEEKLLILKFTDPKWKTTTLENAITWAEIQEARNSEYGVLKSNLQRYKS